MGLGGGPIQVIPKPPQVEAHPFYVGVRDSVDQANHDPSLAYAMVNVYPTDPFVGAGVAGRPGYARTSARVSANVVQGIHQFSKTDGSEYTVVVQGGELYTYDWAGGWTKVVETSDITALGATLSATNRVYFATFVDTLVISDGENSPISWDGTTGGGVANLANCPALYGKPVVHYAKLMGIKASETSTIVWSEENQPNTGYEAGGYNNAWTLGQTEQERLYALIPTNNALFYTRARSIGTILGQVTANWQTTGTHDSVAESIGCKSPGGWVRYGYSIYFVDAEGRPQRIVGNSLDQPGIWRNGQVALGAVETSGLESATAHYNPDTGLIGLGLRVTGAAADTYNDRIFNFQAETGRYVGYFTGVRHQVMAQVKDDDGLQRILHGTDAGYVYEHGVVGGSRWSDADQTGNRVAIAHRLESAPFGYSIRSSKILDRVDVTTLVHGRVTQVAVTVITPAGEDDTGLAYAADAGGTTLWGQFVWGSGKWASDGFLSERVAFGLDSYGRYFRVRLDHEVADERFGIMGMAAEMYPEGADVEVR